MCEFQLTVAKTICFMVTLLLPVFETIKLKDS